LIFGSELKALLANPLVEPKLDAEGLAEIFALGPPEHRDTVYSKMFMN